MDQTQFNGQLVASLAIIVPLLIALGTILVKLNTTINKLMFSVDALNSKLSNLVTRVDDHDAAIHDIQLNCAANGHLKKLKNIEQ